MMTEITSMPDDIETEFYFVPDSHRTMKGGTHLKGLST
jgi:hypothetical protein